MRGSKLANGRHMPWGGPQQVRLNNGCQARSIRQHHGPRVKGIANTAGRRKPGNESRQTGADLWSDLLFGRARAKAQGTDSPLNFERQTKKRSGHKSAGIEDVRSRAASPEACQPGNSAYWNLSLPSGLLQGLPMLNYRRNTAMEPPWALFLREERLRHEGDFYLYKIVRNCVYKGLSG